jgi:excisionase family DNA binding protein
LALRLSPEGANRVNDRLLDAKEVAERLSVPVSWVREQTRLGAIPHIRLGRYVRFEWSEVEAWLERQRVGSGRRSVTRSNRNPTRAIG